jgi:hypothetical protein
VGEVEAEPDLLLEPEGEPEAERAALELGLKLPEAELHTEAEAEAVAHKEAVGELLPQAEAEPEPEPELVASSMRPLAAPGTEAGAALAPAAAAGRGGPTSAADSCLLLRLLPRGPSWLLLLLLEAEARAAAAPMSSWGSAACSAAQAPCRVKILASRRSSRGRPAGLQ